MSRSNAIHLAVAVLLATSAVARAETNDDTDAEDEEVELDPSHGFRLGYTYVWEAHRSDVLLSPHLFVLGYELTHRVVGGEGLDFVVLVSGQVAGLNQNLVIGSFDGILGFRINDRFQVGTGIDLMPFDASGPLVHQVMIAGWVSQAGAFEVPVRFTFMPDTQGFHHLGTTIGVDW